MAGLATDFCVAWTALDARKAGFETYVVEDACRGIDTQGSLAKAWADMAKAGVKRIQSPTSRCRETFETAGWSGVIDLAEVFNQEIGVLIRHQACSRRWPSRRPWRPPTSAGRSTRSPIM